MSGIPTGWEADYDGSRWFYRYKPTGLTQFTFPKIGDEFPEHVGISGETFDLAPEERLASDQQVKRRSALDGAQNEPIPIGSRKRHEPLDEIDEMSATGYFDPASFMYFGQETNNDSSPVANADTHSEQKTSVVAQLDSAVSSLTATPNTGQPATLVINNPPSSEPVISIQTTGDSLASCATAPDDSQFDERGIPMLDGQPIYAELQDVGSASTTHARWTPIGEISELASNDTVKCADELAPVELDASLNQAGIGPGSTQTNGPVELPTERSISPRLQPNSPPEAQHVEAVDSYPIVSASFSFPPLRGGGTSAAAHVPQTISTTGVHGKDKKNQTGVSVANNHHGISQSTRSTSQYPSPETNHSQRSSYATSNISAVQSQELKLGTSHSYRDTTANSSSAPNIIQRHPTILTPSAGPKVPRRLEVESSPQRVPLSPIPSVLQPAKMPLHPVAEDKVSQSAQARIAGSNARHERLSSGLIDISRTDESAQGTVHVSTIPALADPRHSMIPYVHGQKTQRPQSLPSEHQTSLAAYQRGEQSVPPGHILKPTEPEGRRVPAAAIPKPPAFRYITTASNPDAQEPRPMLHKANTVPDQLPSQHVHRPSLSGPGLYVFQEFSSVQGPSITQRSPQEKNTWPSSQPHKETKTVSHHSRVPEASPRAHAADYSGGSWGDHW
ncbi:hypothetical protein BKA67DRAFT_227808 [Truncatella angustata]|uniref:WW domain-containing protein n=1 Tax=Truncatella angustata TaxID=152316 RepID=A0A9P8UN80_9PEZI|nr:uncharacterized protein BKA67DRAFT_227808 [Truncatella angustata]KAH6655160.1 hypothetical protein BKA67DRAFT_227808 [Truncatella angustata]KAH8200445.1 hypothetical protein TruAng_005408 [Truncatella angustata]